MKLGSRKTRYGRRRGSKPLLRPTSRLRTGLFLLVNLLGYAAVNAFWQYLATARWLNLRAEAYWPDRISPLGRMFVEPLSVLQHPWMILVTGLLLGVIVFVPIVVAVLYRLMYAAVFVALVAVVGHVPLLAAALALGALLAARTPLRSEMPFLAVVLGLVPVGLYLYFLGFAGVADAALPLQRWVLYGPVFVAVVSAVLAAALVVALAGWTGFRPGVVWPVLAALLAVPIVIFYSKVGPVELHYAVLVKRLGPGEAIFADVALREWVRARAAEGLNRQTQEIRVREDLDGRKRDLLAACDAFLARRPPRERAAPVLWLRARCLSLQLDEQAFDGDLIRSAASHPLPASRAAWQRIIREAPAAPHAALARRRLGELALRRARTDEADELLHDAAEALRKHVASLDARRDAGETDRIFLPPAAMPGAGHYREALADVERLLWIVKENGVLADAGSAEALAAWLNVCRRGRNRARRLGELAGRYEQTRMGDNLKLAATMTNPDLYERAETLIVLAESKPPTDASIEANYELARLTMGTSEAPALGLIEGLKTPGAYFKAVLAARPNPWQPMAGRLLESLRPTTRPMSPP